MQIQKNASLKQYTTMRLGGTVSALAEVHSEQDLKEALEWAAQEGHKVIMIGEGSNIVWRDEGFDGLLIVNKLSGIEQVGADEASATYKIASGEMWDHVVETLTEQHLSGIECLSLIPGTTGATPVQNVGAYGQEIADVLISLDAYDTKTKELVTIKNADCNFGYRSSRFKTDDKGRFYIISITLRLSKTPLSPPFYSVLQNYLDTNNISDYSPENLRKAVIAIRSEKMPNWHKIANNGSFFANPIVSSKKYTELKELHKDIVAWPYDSGYKLSAGWLLDDAGFKGYHDPETGMATSDKTALVLINEHATSTSDLLKFKEKIVRKVKANYGITLEQEPELLP